MRMTPPYYATLSLALLWLGTAAASLAAADLSLHLLSMLGIGAVWRWPVLLVASGWDALLGMASLSVWRHRSELWLLQLATVFVYSVIVAWGMPEYWLHPFAPLLKNLPIMAMMLWLYRCCRAIPIHANTGV